MLKELVTRFGFEIDDKGLKELQEGIDAVKEGILHLGEALVGEAVGLYEFVSHASEAGVHLRIMSQETGIAADKLQELQFRANLAEVSTDELTQSLNILSRNMYAAKTGSEEQRKAFRLLGISTAELRSGNLTTDKALERVSSTFERMPDGPKKTALAMELFGRAGARMVPFLNELHDQLDPVNQQIFEMSRITEDQIASSHQFDEELKLLKTALTGIARVIGFGLMPVATEVVDAMKKWVVQNRELIVSNLTAFVQGMAAALKLTIKIVDALVQSFAGFAHSIGGVKVATELLLGAFAVLSGATVLYGVGKVIQAVVELGNQFAIANLKAAAIPLAIGAAMVAIFLIMEDIYSFFTGKKSFLGDLLNLLPEVGKVFKTVFEPIFEPLVNIITMIGDGFGSWKDILKQIGILIANVLLAPLRLASALLGNAVSLAGRAFGSDTLKQTGADVRGFADYLKIDPSLGPSGISPQTAVGAPATSKQVNNDLNVTQQFNFPPGTDPAVVGDKISASVSSGLDDVLRATQRATYGGGAY